MIINCSRDDKLISRVLYLNMSVDTNQYSTHYIDYKHKIVSTSISAEWRYKLYLICNHIR